MLDQKIYPRRFISFLTGMCFFIEKLRPYYDLTMTLLCPYYDPTAGDACMHLCNAWIHVYLCGCVRRSHLADILKPAGLTPKAMPSWCHLGAILTPVALCMREGHENGVHTREKKAGLTRNLCHVNSHHVACSVVHDFHMDVRMYACMHVCMHVCMHALMYMYVWMYVCM